MTKTLAATDFLKTKMKKLNVIQIRQLLKLSEMTAKFVGSNDWEVTSGEKTYKVEIFFDGYDGTTTHGYKLTGECNCDAAHYFKACDHVKKVKQQYDNSWSYLFPLFNLPVGPRFGPIHEAAATIALRLEVNRAQQEAA